jgi:hypothetical protein
MTATAHEFNRRAQECTAHRMRQISFENKVETEKQPGGSYKATEYDIYTYRCTGPCAQTEIRKTLTK